MLGKNRGNGKENGNCCVIMGYILGSNCYLGLGFIGFGFRGQGLGFSV